MTHPNHDELIELMYDDGLAPDRRAEVEAHVAACDDCRTQLAAWGGVRRELAAWELPDVRRPIVTPSTSRIGSTVRWAAAAVVLLASGYGLARLTAPAPVDVATFRSNLAEEMRAELRTEAAAQSAQLGMELDKRDRAIQRAVTSALQDMESRNAASFAMLRRDVETVAIQTQAGFEQLASSEQPESQKTRQQQ